MLKRLPIAMKSPCSQTSPKEATSSVVKLGRSNQWTEVLRLVDLALNNSVADCIFLSAAIAACGRAKWQAAVSLLGANSSYKGVEIYNAAIGVCERSSQWQQVMRIFESMCTSRIEKDIITFTSAIKVSQAWTGALDLWRQIVELSLRIDVMCYSAIVNACAADGKWQAALTILDDMAKNSIQADSLIYGSVIKSCDSETGSQAVQKKYIVLFCF